MRLTDKKWCLTREISVLFTAIFTADHVRNSGYIGIGHLMITHEKKLSRWAHGELTVDTVVTAPGPMITAQSRLGEVTAQSRRGHSSVTARSQLSHGEVTAQSRHLQYDHGSVTARSQLNHGPGHDWLWPFWSRWAHGEVTVSSRWGHCELTVSSHGGQFFSHGKLQATWFEASIPEFAQQINAVCFFFFSIILRSKQWYIYLNIYIYLMNAWLWIKSIIHFHNQ